MELTDITSTKLYVTYSLATGYNSNKVQIPVIQICVYYHTQWFVEQPTTLDPLPNRCRQCANIEKNIF